MGSQLSTLSQLRSKRSKEVTNTPFSRFLDVCRLPEPAQEMVFAALSVTLRLRCKEVCREWRALLAAPRFWDVVDLRTGVSSKRAHGVLRAAAIQADFGLEELSVTMHEEEDLLLLFDVVAACARLRVLRVEGVRMTNGGFMSLRLNKARELLTAVPPSCQLYVDMSCDEQEVHNSLLATLQGDSDSLLRRIQVRRLHVDVWPTSPQQSATLLCALASHPTLGGLSVSCVEGDAAHDAVLRLAAERRLTHVSLSGSNVGPASLPALVRLVRSHVVEQLVDNSYFMHNALPAPLLTGPSAAELVAALRDSRTLRVLHLCRAVDEHSGMESRVAFLQLLHSLAGHPTLQELSVRDNRCAIQDEAFRAAFGAALGRLVSTSPTDLWVIDASFCRLRPAGVAGLFSALPHATSVRCLVINGSRLPAQFVRDALLPCVRANASLRSIVYDEPDSDDDSNAESDEEEDKAKKHARDKLRSALGEVSALLRARGAGEEPDVSEPV